MVLHTMLGLVEVLEVLVVEDKELYIVLSPLLLLVQLTQVVVAAVVED